MENNQTKTCSKCGLLKKIDDFHKDITKRDGVGSSCKLCVCRRMKEKYRKINKYVRPTLYFSEKLNEKQCTKCYVIKHIAEFSISKNCKLGVSAMCRSCKCSYSKNRYLGNKEKIKQINKNWVSKNKDKVSTYRKLYNTTQKAKQRRHLYKKNNKNKINIHTTIRRATKRNQTHDGHDVSIEYTLREQCSRISKCLNINHHIDHIYPLAKGGIHHHQNLQILPSKLNLQKLDSLTWSFPPYKSIKDLPDWLYKECETNHRNLTPPHIYD